MKSMLRTLLPAFALGLPALSCSTAETDTSAATPSAQVATASCPGGEPDAEEYAVLASVIKTHFGKDASRLVVMDKTGGADGETLAGQTDLPIAGDAAQDFGSKNKEPSCVQPKFDAGMPATIITQADADAFFQDDLAGGWAKFYEKHQGAQGLMKVTRVGFGGGGNRAVVFVSNAKQSLSAEGTIFTLEKQNGAWVVTGKRIIWIS